MSWKRYVSMSVASFIVMGGIAVAEHDHGRHGDEDYRDRHYYSDHDRDAMRHWHEDREDRLPPGLAKRDQLPPGLERQLRVRGTLPPGLRKRMYPCPPELEEQLPPPPPGCEHTVIGGHIVLVNRSSWMVLDIFHFER